MVLSNILENKGVARRKLEMGRAAGRTEIWPAGRHGLVVGARAKNEWPVARPGGQEKNVLTHLYHKYNYFMND